MKTKNIIVIIAILAIVFGLIWVGGRNQTSSPVTSQLKTGTGNLLSAPEALFDFGNISMAKGKVSHNFKIINPTAKDILIPSVTTSCMCTVANIVKPDGSKIGPFGMPGHGGYVPKADELIKAGETREIEVIYDPAAHGPAGVGPIDRFVYLEDATGGILELEIKAVVTP